MAERQSEEVMKIHKYWKRQLDQGKDYKKKYAKPELWKDYKDMYRGEWDDKVVPVNKIFSIGRSLIPRTYFRDPLVTLTARRPEFAWHARVLEQVDNLLIPELRLKKQMKRCVIDAYTCGTAVLKLGFDSEFGFIPDLIAGKDSETGSRYDKKTGDSIEYNQAVRPGMPWALRTDPSDIIVPWGYASDDDLPWIAHEFIRTLADVKADTKYNPAITKELKGGFVLDRDAKPIDSRKLSLDPEEIYVKLTEIRDFKTRSVIVIAEDAVLLNVEDTLSRLTGSVYEFIIPNPDPDYFWGIPDVKLITEQQKELNEIRTQASKQRRLATLRFLYKKGVLQPDALETFLAGDENGIGIEVNHENLQAAISLLQPHVAQDLYREGQETEHNMDETVGYSRNVGGEFKPGTPPTAAETAQVSAGADARSDERRDIYADVLVNIIRKWNQMIFKYWTGEKVVQVTGPDGAKQWIKFTAEELMEGVSEYIYKIDPDSGTPVTRNLRHAQSMEAFKVLNGDPLIDQVQLRQMLIRQYDWIDPSWQLILKPGQQVIPPELAAKTGGVPKGMAPGPGGPVPLASLKPPDSRGGGGG